MYIIKIKYLLPYPKNYKLSDVAVTFLVDMALVVEMTTSVERLVGFPPSILTKTLVISIFIKII